MCAPVDECISHLIPHRRHKTIGEGLLWTIKSRAPFTTNLLGSLSRRTAVQMFKKTYKITLFTSPCIKRQYISPHSVGILIFFKQIFVWNWDIKKIYTKKMGKFSQNTFLLISNNFSSSFSNVLRMLFKEYINRIDSKFKIECWPNKPCVFQYYIWII